MKLEDATNQDILNYNGSLSEEEMNELCFSCAGDTDMEEAVDFYISNFRNSNVGECGG